jgi:DNA-binding transcriptional ArsR family regulator
VVRERAAQGALQHPLRRRILETLAAPGSATTVAGSLDVPRQLVNYHLRVLEKAGLVEEVGSRRKRGLTERLVRATAAHYVMSPDAVGAPATTRDAFSSTYQVAVAARTIREVAALAALARDAGKRLTTLTLDTEIRFASPADREAFGNELVGTIQTLVARYHSSTAPNGRSYRLFAGAHPVYLPPSAEEPQS